MPLFPFKSNAHFVTSSDGTILQVYELTKPTNQLPFVKKADWKQVTTITASLEEEDDASDEKSYNGLAFFDGHGKIEGEKALTTLAQHLKQLHLLVNPKGYCFQDVSDLGMYSDFGIHYLRLNDLFSWPCHKIDLTTSNVWGRLELKYNSPSKRQGPSPKSSKPSVGGGVSKEKYAKLEMLVKEKDEELEKLKILKKKKDDEDAKTKRIEELEKLNEELEDELEQCRKLSWAILPSTSFLPQSADAKEKYLTRRQRIAPEKLVCNALLSFPYVTNSPKLVDNMYNWSSNRVRLVDEESSSSTWPAPPNLDIRIGRGVLDFDRNNWWYVKTTHPEGGLTMLVYYDGNQSQLTLASPSCIVPLPYAKGVEFITYTYRLSLFDLTPLGFRLGFTYRPA
ncbi:hypothetical protein LINGRAHAP2_LOCUS8140 [Linum grandiflorum]